MGVGRFAFRAGGLRFRTQHILLLRAVAPVSDDEYDGETIDDIDPDEGGFTGSAEQVTVKDGEDLAVYVGDDRCYRCSRSSTGVVVADVGDGEKIHHPICEVHLKLLENSDETMNFEFRAYE